MAAAACGSRTGILGEGRELTIDASTDVAADRSIRDAGLPEIDAGRDAPIVIDCDACAPDTIACTIDRCDRDAGCVHLPDDTLCPPGQGCDPLEGCVDRILANATALNDAGAARQALIEVRVPSYSSRVLSFIQAVSLSDVASMSDGRVYGVTSGSGFPANTAVMLVDPHTGAPQKVAELPGWMNALEASSGTTLYAAGDFRVYELDLKTGAHRDVAQYPTGTSSSGDLAFFQGHLYATARATDGFDLLLEVELARGTMRTIGPTGYVCMYGLAVAANILHGLTCNGDIVALDVTTGRGSPLAKSTFGFSGAAGR